MPLKMQPEDAGHPAQPVFTHKVRTCLWMDQDGEAAARFYCSLLADSFIEGAYLEAGAGGPLLVDFVLRGAPYQILNGGPFYKLTPAASISVLVEDQAEADRLWFALTANGGEESMCGWLTDRFGVSWQITPERLMRLLLDPDRAAAARATDVMMKQRRIDLAPIEKAFAGK